MRAALYKTNADVAEEKRQAGRVTRALGRLRAHGLIRKVTGTHRYLVTVRGREMIAAILSARQASVVQLLKLAA